MTLAGPAAVHLEEPALLFGDGRAVVDPKAGLSLFGPYAAPKSPINVGIIGDKTTITQAEAVLRGLAQKVPGSPKHPAWKPSFPGLSQLTPFQCELNVPDKWICTIKRQDIDDLEEIKQKSTRIGTAVRLITAHMAAVEDRDEVPDVFVCAIPHKMFRLCTNDNARDAAGDNRAKKTWTDSEQDHIFNYFTDDDREKYGQEIMDASAKNFHSALKARAMRFTPRTQMIRPDTLGVLAAGGRRPGQSLQDDATVAWNLAAGLLYKSECRLWKPAGLPADTCFVGVSFYRVSRPSSGAVGTSMAQVFTPEGEGFVMRGDEFPWAGKGSPHLGSAPAERLLKKAIGMYTRQTEGRPPGRLVLHKSSRYTAEELEGFEKAVGSIDHDLVAILDSPSGIAVFRQGRQPVLRGTMVELPGSRWLLYTSGHVPFLGLYPGPHTPNPLEIAEHHGDSAPRQICKEVLMLTKLNWNSADFASHLPITLQFSRRVGDIMKEAPEVLRLQHKYMYYM